MVVAARTVKPVIGFSAAPEVAAAAEQWLTWLRAERRVSAHTLTAYGTDLASFLTFLTGHLGAPPDFAALAGLKQGDFRAWLAARRNEKLVATSLARGLSALRNFFRHLQPLHKEISPLMEIPGLTSVHLAQ